MSATGAAPARIKPCPKNLTREEAIEIINKMPYLVCQSRSKLLQSQITATSSNARGQRPDVYTVAFEVADGNRTYVFEPQPFRVLREITRREFLTVAGRNAISDNRAYFYEIHTD